MDDATLDNFAREASRHSFGSEAAELLGCLAIALSIEHEPATVGRLLAARAIARQADADPMPAARDALEAAELLHSTGDRGWGAYATAIAAGMIQRTGAIVRSVDLAVQAMMLTDGVAIDEPGAVRAHNALGVIFGQLPAFDLAIPPSRYAFEAIDRVPAEGRNAVLITLCQLHVEGAHAGVTVDLDLAARAADRLADAEEPVGRAMGLAFLVELALLRPSAPEQLVARIAELDAVAEALGSAAPRLAAYLRFVRAQAARHQGRDDEAVRLLDAAIPVLVDVADDSRSFRAIALRSEARFATGDTAGGLDDARWATRAARGRQVGQIARLAAEIADRASLERVRASLRQHIDRLTDEIAIDPVTGLGTRRWLEESLDAPLNDDGSVAVVMLDLDHFKQINDRWGHLVGDEVLGAVGRIVRDSVGHGDAAARFGGEEVVIVLPGATASDAQRLAERILSAVWTHSWDAIVRGLRVTASAGVAAGRPTETRRTLELADRALYVAKRAGRNRVERVDTETAPTA